jgi:phosphate transport system permease protein
MSNLSARIGKIYIISSTLISVAAILLILVFLFINSGDAVTRLGWRLFTLEWHPSTESYGILSMVFGSVVITMLALVFAVPLGVFSAIFISEMLPSGYRLFVKSLLEVLAGIPSIIYGLVGIAFFSVWIRDFYHLQSGRTILTAGILLSIMILPTIITLTDDALHNVPGKYREAARGLGLYDYEIVKSVVLPIARADILGAVLLALGRALGETMAVMLVIGSIDKIPQPVFNFLVPGQTITSKLGREIAESSFGSLHFSTLIFMGLLLLVIVLILTITAQFYFKKEQRLYE